MTTTAYSTAKVGDLCRLCRQEKLTERSIKNSQSLNAPYPIGDLCIRRELGKAQMLQDSRRRAKIAADPPRQMKRQHSNEKIKPVEVKVTQVAKNLNISQHTLVKLSDAKIISIRKLDDALETRVVTKAEIKALSMLISDRSPVLDLLSDAIKYRLYERADEIKNLIASGALD